MNSVASFDKHSTIEYLPTRKPYWGRYPYRVSVLLDTKTASRCRFDMKKLARARAKLASQIEFPSDATPKTTWLAAGQAFFFETAEEATLFIDANVDRICDVHRPLTCEPDVLMDSKVRVQKHLYWLQFRYKINFNTRTWRRDDEQTQMLDEWAIEEFHNGEDDIESPRGLYSVSDVRCLYLRDERDILLVQLMVGPYIRDIERVVLISELEEATDI